MNQDQPQPVKAMQTQYATPALVLGVLSIVLTGCFVIGLILGIVGLVQSRRGKLDLQENPHLLGENIVTAGQVCSIIGLAISVLQAILWSVYFLVILVVAVSSN